MNAKDRLAAIDYAYLWVDSSEAYESSDEVVRENALKVLNEMHREAWIADAANELVEAWAEQRPDVKKAVLRQHALKKAREIYKNAK